MASAAFERFRFSFFEDKDSARQGLDTDALAALAGEERGLAEDMLLDHLPDTRGVIGLGILRSARAESALQALLEAANDPDVGREQIYLATALWQIRPDPGWLAPVTEALAAADEPLRRMAAAQALAAFGDPAAVRALTAALDDADGLVRHHAARGLLKLHGLPTPSDDYRHMIYRVMADAPETREAAKRDILAAIEGRAIGAQ